MKKLLLIGLVFVLALSLGTGAVFAGGKGPIPSIDVFKVAEAVLDGVISNVTIFNTGDVMVNVTKVTDTVYWQEGDGDWKLLEEPYEPYVDDNNGNGYEIDIGEELELYYSIICEIPETARELRNVVEVEIEGRDKVFRDVVSFLPYNYMPEIEIEGEVVSIDTDSCVIATVDGDYTVLFDSAEIEGELVIGDPAKVEGVLQSEYTILASKIEGTEIEDEESGDEGESVVEPVSAVKGQGQSGKSHSWHVNLYQKDSDTWEVIEGGASGRLNCQIEDGTLTGVFNGKGLESGVEYCLINYIEPAQNPWPAEGTAVVCLGSGTANKAGKVNIKADGYIGDPDEMPETGDYVGETGDKIWLVPCADVVEGMIIAWNPDSYLFEDVLINTPSE